MAKNVVKHIWNEITQLFETVYPRTISSNVLHGGTTVEVELNNKADADHTHSRITNNLVIGTTETNKAEITFDISQAGSPQILMTDNEGDNRWAIGADDADNNFSIHGSTSSNPVINNMATPFFEITTDGTIKNSGVVLSKDGHTHDSRYYTESEVDTRLANKSDTSHNHDSRYYTESEINTKLSSKSDTSHTHDSRYYTESEINTKLAAKADTSHNHDASYYTKTQINTAYHTAANVSATNTGWVSSNGQYYKDISDAWFSGAADEYVNVVPSQASYDNALVLTGLVETLAGKIRIWATAVPAGTITINYQAQRGV